MNSTEALEKRILQLEDMKEVLTASLREKDEELVEVRGECVKLDEEVRRLRALARIQVVKRDALERELVRLLVMHEP